MIEHSIWLGSLNAVHDTAAKVRLGHSRYAADFAKYREKIRTSMSAKFSNESAMSGYISQRAGRQGRTAMLNIRDGMVHRAEWWHEFVGIASYEAINHGLMSAAADDSIDSILLNLDTPGGMVSGLDSVTDTMAKIDKPIIAYTDGIMASAGYWIGSNADLVIGSRMSTVGSVGALVIRQDVTKMLEDVGIKMEIYRAGDNKARLNPFEDMREEDKQALLSDLNESYQEFLNQIVVGRKGKVSRAGLEELTEHGRTFSGKVALEKKLLDGNASLIEVLEQMDEKINNNDQDPIGSIG